MIELDPTRFKLKPYSHQLDGTKALVKHAEFALFDEPGVGKTKQVIDAAGTLFTAEVIDTVVVACPASVKTVWADRTLGEIRKHSFVDHFIFDYKSKNEKLLPALAEYTKNRLLYIIVSYEFLRQKTLRSFEKQEALSKFLKKRKVMLVCDEGSELGNWKSKQFKATLKLREGCDRIALLDGTPAGNSPKTLFSKMKMLNTAILGYATGYVYENVHAIKGGYMGKQIVGWKNLDRVSERIKPHCLRRMKRDCLDLPKRVQTTMAVPLDPRVYTVYKELRDELVTELESGTVMVNYASVKVLRLAQLCAGFLGGVVNDQTGDQYKVQEIHNYTLLAFKEWLRLRLEEDPNFKCVVWCRWRPEIDRLAAAMSESFIFSGLKTGVIYGGEACENFMHPDHPYDGPGVLICQPQASKYGANFAKASHNFWLSYDYDLVVRQQAGDRIDRPGQRNMMVDTDVIVTGPEGQRTVIHDIRKSLVNKTDMTTRITADWVKTLKEE
jgi:hypothetical protein